MLVYDWNRTYHEYGLLPSLISLIRISQDIITNCSYLLKPIREEVLVIGVVVVVLLCAAFHDTGIRIIIMCLALIQTCSLPFVLLS